MACRALCKTDALFLLHAQAMAYLEPLMTSPDLCPANALSSFMLAAAKKKLNSKDIHKVRRQQACAHASPFTFALLLGVSARMCVGGGDSAGFCVYLCVLSAHACLNACTRACACACGVRATNPCFAASLRHG